MQWRSALFDIFHVFIVLMMIGLDEGFGINWLGYVHGRSLSNCFGFFFFWVGGKGGGWYASRERPFRFQTMWLNSEGLLDSVQQWFGF